VKRLLPHCSKNFVSKVRIYQISSNTYSCHTTARTHTRHCEFRFSVFLSFFSFAPSLTHTCTQMSDITEYGLQLDSNGAPMPKFTNDVTLNRASGGWVKRTLMVHKNTHTKTHTYTYTHTHTHTHTHTYTHTYIPCCE